ncbi:MAG: hypothetical protein Q9159_007366, partial [Coniocarpon cinnabarinum]
EKSSPYGDDEGHRPSDAWAKHEEGFLERLTDSHYGQKSHSNGPSRSGTDDLDAHSSKEHGKTERSHTAEPQQNSSGSPPKPPSPGGGDPDCWEKKGALFCVSRNINGKSCMGWLQSVIPMSDGNETRKFRSLQPQLPHASMVNTSALASSSIAAPPPPFEHESQLHRGRDEDKDFNPSAIVNETDSSGVPPFNASEQHRSSSTFSSASTLVDTSEASQPGSPASSHGQTELTPPSSVETSQTTQGGGSRGSQPKPDGASSSLFEKFVEKCKSCGHFLNDLAHSPCPSERNTAQMRRRKRPRRHTEAHCTSGSDGDENSRPDLEGDAAPKEKVDAVVPKMKKRKTL